MQAEADLAEARCLTETTQVVYVTHQDLSHGTHDRAVSAVLDRLAAAGIDGPTTACSLAQARWQGMKQHDKQKEVTHEGLAVPGMRLVKGSMAFSAYEPSGAVALHPTAVFSVGANTPAQHAVEECFVIDEQARVLKSQYLSDAAARSTRARRLARSSAPSCMPVALYTASCVNTVLRTSSGTHTTWSSSQNVRSFRARSSRCQSAGACTRVPVAGRSRGCQQFRRSARYRSAVLCTAVTKARAVAIL